MSVTKDPRQWIETYFGVRNGIKGNPVEGVNFTRETLTYMTPANRADQVTKLIVDKMKELGNPAPFPLVECCAGMGGNTISFLLNPAVQWTVSYEILPERREMLKKNLMMYNLTANNRAFVPDDEFTGVKPNWKNVMLYFDPPWLPANVPGDQSTKDQYILHGIKIGDKTLEQWIASCPNCSLVAARVPPGYQMDPIPGFKIETMLLPPKKNSLLIFVYPDKSGQTVKVQPPTPISQPLQKLPPLGKLTLNPSPTGTTQSRTTQPLVTQTLTNLPPGVYQKDIEWYNGLKSFLGETLKTIIPNSDFRKKMTSDEAMKIWVPCFTHETYNPNVGMNYESLELVGDHAMEYNFILYLYHTVPNITPEGLSLTKSKYISKTFQAQVGLEMGLEKWVRINGEMNTHVFEDLLESFFGGVNLVGDKVFKFGAGTGLCYNLIIQIFKNVKINVISSTTSTKHPKSVMKETFEQLHWGKPIEDYVTDDNYVTTATISFTPEAIASLQASGRNVTSVVLASTQGNTKKVASDSVYRLALENLRKLGISEEMVDEIRARKDMENPMFSNLIPQVQDKTKKMGYSSFYLKKPKHQQSQEGTYIQLIGTKQNGTLEVLAMTDGYREESEGKKEVLEKYLSQ